MGIIKNRSSARNRNGMTLISVIMAMGLLSAVLYLVISSLQVTQKGARGTHAMLDVANLSSTLQYVFHDPSCGFNTSGGAVLSLDPTSMSTFTSVPIQEILVAGNPVLTANTLYEGLQVSQLEFSRQLAPAISFIDSSGNPRNRALFEVTTQLDRPTGVNAQLGAPSFRKSFTVGVVTDPASTPAHQIVGCSNSTSLAQSQTVVKTDFFKILKPMGETPIPGLSIPLSLSEPRLAIVTTRVSLYAQKNSCGFNIKLYQGSTLLDQGVWAGDGDSHSAGSLQLNWTGILPQGNLTFAVTGTHQQVGPCSMSGNGLKINASQLHKGTNDPATQSTLSVTLL